MSSTMIQGPILPELAAGNVQAAAMLAEARARTLLLIASVTEEDLRRQHDPLMGPILWDLGHIAHFEELWLLRNLEGEIRFGEMPGMFNPFEHPRAVRGALELPTLAQTLAHMAETRARVLAALDAADFGSDNPLLRAGYVYHMVAQHEYQHGETMLQTLQLKQGAPYRAPRAIVFPDVPARGLDTASMVRFPGGAVRIGTHDRRTAYDNERPEHEVELEPFAIDVTPVTNARFLEFMADGGYARPELWTEAGRAWLAESGAQAPRYWVQHGGEWHRRVMDRSTPVAAAADHPVIHVCAHEADAYARWAGKRLPTEAEWEAAACWDAAAGVRRDYPWGDEAPSPLHANVDQLAFDTAPVGTFGRNVSPLGCYGMIGDAWEWTATSFTGYPGFEAFPYREYSQVFFGDEYRVLRGGSWATRRAAIRGSFRNWDYPIRRQIFSGFRCARDD
jgi:iron(II)-dependent oxidoreductase